MQLLSTAFVIFLSSGASPVLGSNIRGAGVEKEHSKLSADRRLSWWNGNEGEAGGLASPQPEVEDEDFEGVKSIVPSFWYQPEVEDEDDVEGDENLETEALEEVEDEGSVRRGGGDRRGEFDKHANKGCRSRQLGMGSEYSDFDLYWNVSRVGCKRRCTSLGQSCFGYEFSPNGHGRGKCEVWRVPIYFAVGYVHGVDCYIRKSAQQGGCA